MIFRFLGIVKTLLQKGLNRGAGRSPAKHRATRNNARILTN